jgi:hypothetical protein
MDTKWNTHDSPLTSRINLQIMHGSNIICDTTHWRISSTTILSSDQFYLSYPYLNFSTLRSHKLTFLPKVCTASIDLEAISTARET